MARVTRVAPHLTVEEVKQKLHTATTTWLRQRWMVIYTAMLDPRPAEEIATQLGASRPFVSKITSLYKRFGPQGLETVGPGGRRNEYLSKDQETAFLAPFIERAAQGQIVSAKVIHQAFAQRIGHEVDQSTIYRLLQRHQWRKVMPRPITHNPIRMRKQRLKKLQFARQGRRDDQSTRGYAPNSNYGTG